MSKLSERLQQLNEYTPIPYRHGTVNPFSEDIDPELLKPIFGFIITKGKALITASAETFKYYDSVTKLIESLPVLFWLTDFIIVAKSITEVRRELIDSGIVQSEDVKIFRALDLFSCILKGVTIVFGVAGLTGLPGSTSCKAISASLKGIDILYSSFCYDLRIGKHSPQKPIGDSIGIRGGHSQSGISFTPNFIAGKIMSIPIIGFTLIQTVLFVYSRVHPGEFSPYIVAPHEANQRMEFVPKGGASRKARLDYKHNGANALETGQAKQSTHIYLIKQ